MINVYYIEYNSEFFLGWKRDYEKRSFNKAIKKATIELVRNLTNIGSKFNSSSKLK